MKALFLIILSVFVFVDKVSADTWSSTVGWISSSNITECWTSYSHWLLHQWVPQNNTSVSQIGTANCNTHTYFNNFYTDFFDKWTNNDCPDWYDPDSINYYNNNSFVTRRSIFNEPYQWNNWNRYRLLCTSWLFPDVVFPSTDSYYNRGHTFGCPNEKRAVRIQYFNQNTLVETRDIGAWPYTGNNWNRYRIHCRSWDDTPPDVSATNDSQDWRNEDIIITLNVSDTWVNWGSEGSLDQARYIWNDENWLNSSCTSWGTVFENWDTIIQSNEWSHILYICSRDFAWNIWVWQWTYKLDKTIPQWTITYFNWWTNNTEKTIDITFSDPLPVWVNEQSWIFNYTLERRINENNPEFPSSDWSGWLHVPWCVNQTSEDPCSAWNLENYTAYQYRLIVRDNAWNVTTVTSENTIKIDITDPTVNDIITQVSTNLLARDNQSYLVEIDNNEWAPITKIRTVREAHDSQNLNIHDNDDDDCNSDSCLLTWNISLVDNYRINDISDQNHGSRRYTFRYLEFCDAAWNCWEGEHDVYHYVYANNSVISSPTNPIIWFNEELSDSQNFATWNPLDVTIDLSDRFGNSIIPANGIGREVNFSLDIDNHIRLNQHSNSWDDSALFIGTNTNPVGLNNIDIQLNNQISDDWEYTIPFFIYAPSSASSDSLIPWNASINSIHYSITHNDEPEWNNENIEVTTTPFNIVAQPLYTLDFSWDMVVNWFIEWATQSLSVELERALWWHSSNARRVWLEFWELNEDGDMSPNSLYNLEVSGWTNNLNLQPWNMFQTILSNYPASDSSTQLETFLAQRPGVVVRNTLSYLASIVEYNVWGRTVRYPQDIIWKTAYHDWDNQDWGTFQRWVRILGLTSSQRTDELLEDQFINDARILWNLSKSEIRRDIHRSVSELTRNIQETPQWTTGIPRVTLQTWSNSWWSLLTWWWRVLPWWDIIYFKNPDTWIVRVWWEISWTKTIIVEKWDVYIDGNITGDGNLWIIVLRWTVIIDWEEVQVWGNVYINPWVTDIHASIFADRSLVSYDGSNILDWSTSLDTLRHQLYIYGSIFSENTIGTSRSVTPVCPFYIPTASCTREQAQAYDFNYIRRYFVNANDETSWLQSQWTLDRSDLRDFPFVIEYNPSIQTLAPPLFEIQSQ